MMQLGMFPAGGQGSHVVARIGIGQVHLGAALILLHARVVGAGS